jgi:4-hydroxybenzoate polyprenyltransferase
LEEQHVVRANLRLLTAVLRCDQWVKNVFVFGGVLFGGEFTKPDKLLDALAAFLLFSSVASAAYIENDIVDRESDRAHPGKRTRPFASGAISPASGHVLATILLAIGLVGGALFRPTVAVILVLYFIMNIAYSRWLKHVVVIDVMVIATGFVLRVLAGCAAVAVPASNWILLCTFLVALFLGFGKRRHELLLLDGKTVSHRPVLASYGVKFLDQMMVVVSAVTIMCYILYTVWPDTVERHGTTNLIYTVPFVLYGIFRYDFLIYQEREGGNPTGLVLTDRPLIAAVVLWAVCAAAILSERWLARMIALPTTRAGAVTTVATER